MKNFTVIFGSFFLIATLLPLIKTGIWWIRVFDYPRLQIAFFLLVSLILVIIFWGWTKPVGIFMIGSLFLAFCYQAVLISKYTTIYHVQAKEAVKPNSENVLRILEANIRMQNKKVYQLIGLIKKHDPDIVVVTEVDNWWVEQLQEFDQAYPYSLKYPLENTYGMLLLSKLPLKNMEVNFLVNKEIPSFYATATLRSGAEVDIHSLHPEPPRPGTPTYERDTEILLIGKRVKKANRPCIVVGDLNDVAWSYTSDLFQRYSGLLDPRQGRGLYNTYNVFVPFFRYPLDHFFYSEHFGFISLKALEKIGSDHFPMLLEICYEKQVDHVDEKPKADVEDKMEVEEKIKEGFEKE